MAIIAKYKFDSNLCADYLPTFNSEFTGYTKSDVNNSDGTITRTISHDTLKPTLMRFGGAINTSTDREKSLLEVMECDTSNVTSMHTMFSGCSNLISLNTSNFDTSKVTNMFFAFNGCLSLASLNLSSFDTSKVTNMNSIFENCSALTSLNVSSWDTSNVTDIAYMFNNCKSLTSLDLSSFNTSKATNMTKIFNGCSKLTSLVLSNFNTSKVENMTNMFTNCSSLTSLDISNFNTSKVTTMRDMFSGCSSLTSLNVSSFDTGNVTIMYAMFQNCSSLTTLDLSNFNTSKVTNMNSIFENCSALASLNVSSFDTSKVTDMAYMFNRCSSLTSLDVSNFNTNEVTTIRYMFYSCSKLTTLDLSNFNTSKVTNMSWMFNGCSKLTTLDLSNFDTSQVTDMSYMLNGCTASDIGLLYATSSTINSLLTHLGTATTRNIYYTDAPLNELTVQDNITYKKYELTKATLPYTLNKLPNGVVDYIDVVNKVHVQGVEEIDLSQVDWIPAQHNNSNYIGGYSSSVNSGTYNKKFKRTSIILSGMEELKGGYTESLQDLAIRLHSDDSAFLLYTIKKQKLLDAGIISSLDEYVNSQKLQSYFATLTNVKVYGELATPIYTPLTDEEIAQLPLSAYADGYINLSSDQLMPSFEFRMRASNRYQVDMLEKGYYYLNAPVGNVKLGTANVDVQQMPCMVKVDNVGTGDSGYRLGFDNPYGCYLDLKEENVVLNYYLDNNGLPVSSMRDAYYAEYIPVNANCEVYIEQTSLRTSYSIGVNFYDENKTNISKINNYDKKIVKISNFPNNAKYVRISTQYNESNPNDTNVCRIIVNPITLAKLPSHRIPKSFTQGMRCATDFGYWEGIKESNAISFRTVNTSSGWSIVESISIKDGIGVTLNRIEYGNTIVEDEFDIATGKLIKRIGIMTLDGSENWKQINDKNTEDDKYVYKYQLRFNDMVKPNFKPSKGVISNRHPYQSSIWDFDKEGVSIGGSDIVLALYREKAHSLEVLKQYLATSPLTIYYELAVPEISYPNISSPQAKTVANTALQCAHHNGYLNPQVKPSHLTYPVPSLVGNREYTVVHNRKNINGSTKPITLDLGGTQVELNDASSKTLVKTPSTLKHSSLIFIGGESTVDHVMVLDGDWTNKPIEYFENMKGHDTDATITIIGDGKIDDVAEQYLW